MFSLRTVINVAFLTCVTAVSLKFNDPLIAQEGLGWPQSLQVAAGHEALMKLAVTLENQESCQVTTPGGVIFDIDSPPSNRFSRWEETCSLKLKEVREDDTGRWRLTATGGNTTVMGWTEVHVIDHKPATTAPPIILQDGKSMVQIDLSTEYNSYCLVAKPFSDSALVPGHCSVTLDKTTRAVQGTWYVLLGAPGRMAEVPMRREVVVEAERLDVGYIHDNNKLHLYCNILHTEKNITFCRFQRTSKLIGYHVVDGLSDGKHSYYGKGFLRKECGITIQNPIEDDYGSWRCTLGVNMWEDKVVKEQLPMQALISVAPKFRGSSRQPRDIEDTTIFVQEDSPLLVSCHADFSLKYCWFQHPNGSQFTPVRLVNEDQPYWYTGEGLAVGQCGITFKHVTKQDSGIWHCHMGPKRQAGIETTDNIEVRVTGPLAANKREIQARIGESITLFCHTANGNRPLDYCRFLSPSFVGFNIDSSVTKADAILDRFYFTPGRNITVGDCSLTISSVREDDIGNWTCAAIVNDDVMESSDVIRVFTVTESRYQAGVIGGSIGAALLVLVLMGYVFYKRGSTILSLFKRQNPPSLDGVSLQRMSGTTGVASRCSHSSNESERDMGIRQN
ncbi:uncharacterized protein LOC110992528 [Pieris rapae]|uniref:uncharacterized protein LOC110992528 n=1 Tax=Pieris rapae TaxID=64459 RepID=UPI001E27D2A7|nr:uncharacterized protein LOC110992528 [Pieris rapae]